MKIYIIAFFVVFWSLSDSVVVRTDQSRILINKPKLKDKNPIFMPDHIRSKRYLGLSKRFKLNKRYQECVGPGDAKGHCKHLSYCPVDVLSNSVSNLEYVCIIENRYVGVCCPDDITTSAMAGSQLVMDLPAGGYDYNDAENTTGCGIPAEGRSLTAAKNSSLQEWPWMAALYRPKQLEQGLEQHFCGGVLITDIHVLTASHCTIGLTASEIRVRLGEYDFKTQGESRSRDYNVAKIIQHENFVLATYENDIAIVKLEKPTIFNSYIWPICLPPLDESFEGETVVVAGWGKTAYDGQVSPVLLQVTIPVWPLQKCIDAFAQRITKDNVCAAGYEGNEDSCVGDSGGPLMYQLKNGRWITVGIVSWGIGCGNKGYPGIYTKVNNYLPWIIKHTIAKK